MELSTPGYPESIGFMLSQLFYEIGFFGPIFVVVAIILVVWLFILLFRTRPLIDYFAFIAATFYPLLLGVLGGALGAVHAMYLLGQNGISSPGPDPTHLARTIGESLLCLIVGSLLTCIFFPAGILL